MDQLLDWHFWVETTRGGFHFVAALLAIVLGPVILMRRKGDQPHRWLGRIWVAAMLIVNISALTMYDISGRPNLFHIFAVLSLATMIPGFWAIRAFKKTRNRARLIQHQYFMVWAYFGLCMAGFWQMVTTGFQISGAPQTPFVLYGLGAMTFIFASITNHWIKKAFSANS